jgi:sterol desaturase/sphingolipid hydroxylase (fatty acid hydroxylase superfamily)
VAWWDLTGRHQLEMLAAPFSRLFSPQGNLFWLYLLSSTAIAAGVYLAGSRDPTSRSLRSGLAFIFPPSIYRHRSAILDFKYFAVNTAAYGVFIAPILLTSQSVAKLTISSLVGLFGVPEGPVVTGVVGAVGSTGLLVVAADLGFFISHYLQHKVPALWAFHAVHHSAEVLHPITGYRAHPVDQALDALLIAIATGIVVGVAGYFVGVSTGPVTVLGANMFAFLTGVAGTHLRHSHVWLSYGRWLSHIFVSPAMHQIHHSSEPTHLDQNLGGIFAVWDWAAGSLHIPEGREKITLGLRNGEQYKYRSVADLYLLPLRSLLRR